MEIFNLEIKAYLKQKAELVKKGRKLTARIEGLERKIDASKDRQRKHTEACNPAELIEKGDALRDEINGMIEELEAIAKEIQDIKVASIPQKEVDVYEGLKKEKELMETERMNIGMKLQSLKNENLPLIHETVKPYLGEYDDIEQVVLKGEKVHVTVFNHLNDWKKRFAESQAKKQAEPEKEAEAA